MPKEEIDPVDLHVGNKIRQCRILAGMSQDAVGKIIGISFQQIQKYERGTNRIGSSRLYQFSRLFDVSIESFFEGLKDTYDMPHKTNTGLSERESLQILQNYSQLSSPKLKHHLNGLVKACAEISCGFDVKSDTHLSQSVKNT
jgi:transcriptional regulator with XRE-family HTH domain